MNFSVKKVSKFTVNSLSVAILLSSTNVLASNFDINIEYEPAKTTWDKLIDIGSSWVRRQGKKSENAENAYYFSGSPTLEQWRSGTSNWQQGACLSSNASNSGVWLNDVKESYRKTGSFATYGHLAEKQASYKQYIISANTPYELESKNFKRAGLKRFADYHYSFRIADSSFFSGNSTVIDNKKSHDYDAIHSFSLGTSWVHSATFSDFEWSIGFKNNTGDINYSSNWSNPSNYSVRGSWGGDVYLSDCGFAEVITEPNTRPVIKEFSAVNAAEVVTNENPRFETWVELKVTDIADYHTSKDNLIYKWVVTHQSGKKSTTYGMNASVYTGAVPLFGAPHGADRGVKAQLIVSDGDLSTISEKNI